MWLASDRAAEREASGWSTRAALTALRSSLTLRSSSARHAIRFGAALAAGVTLYRILGMTSHGFWIPLTILFVMRPEREETYHRLVLRRWARCSAWSSRPRSPRSSVATTW